ncbi:LolA family protein [Pedomonas mirosovicensis]|uniref:LolA family protein n=1 Tax=Pedomonas mirosovicensis TaxID=2908641 RepID=UPI002166CF15|nr:outer membrane lipoprotein carrier protein LolA [Pedomonas mirosovicensis]MCH8684127.1 outer membrane lipoprotein carrier protein LolA [Pedomonas mirosovicensis]
MRFLIAPLLCLATLGAAAAPAAAQIGPAATAQSSSAALAQIESHLRQVKSLQADFTQTADTGAVAKGKMILAKPGKVRFDFGKDSPLLIVSNGSVLSMVDYDVAQVTRWPVKETPLALLLDDKVSLKGRATVLPPSETPEGFIAIEGRDPKHPEYGTITLFFQKTPKGPAGVMLMGWRVLDGQGRTTLVQLANQKLNEQVSDSAFRFKDPRGLRTSRPGRTR